MAPTPRLYFDSNVFITAFESDGDTARLLGDVFRQVEGGSAEAFTSELTLAEVLVRPYADGDSELAATYVAALASTATFRVVPVDRETLVRAARLRSERPSIKLPDAIHLAAAELCDCGVVVSNDRDLVPREPMRRSGLGTTDLRDLMAFLA